VETSARLDRDGTEKYDSSDPKDPKTPRPTPSLERTRTGCKSVRSFDHLLRSCSGSWCHQREERATLRARPQYTGSDLSRGWQY